MKSRYFDIQFDKNTGTVCSLVNPEDKHQMNWCVTDGGWGQVISNSNVDLFGGNKEMELESFFESDNTATAVFSNGLIKATAEYFFAPSGRLNQRFTIKNLMDFDVFLEHGNLGFKVALNDVYTYADDCMTNRSSAHLWCGNNVTYINALKMGVADINLGLMLKKGDIRTYSVVDCDSNIRGKFILDNNHIELIPFGEYTVEWELFWHKGTEDFMDKLREYPNFIDIKSDNYTVFIGESIGFTATVPPTAENIKIVCDGVEIPFDRQNNAVTINYTPTQIKEYRFDIYADDIHTYTEFNVSEKFDKLIEKRANFIVDNQQVNNPDSRLYGAYVIYDTEKQYKIFNHKLTCHNACMERLGMALFIAKYLQLHPENQKIRASFDRFVDFMMREFFDADTGMVYGSIGKPEGHVRLYNAPWVASLLADTYLVTGDKKYLLCIPKLLDLYYHTYGGFKFYPNGFLLKKIVDALKNAELFEEYNYVLKCFEKHVDNMIKVGASYPKHEVNYEQTIVSPAASFIAEMGVITGDKKYTSEAYRHIALLERFNGNQPSFHLDETPIRYWDAFWGGKTRLRGDTFPQYWSCLTARSYKNYYLISGDKRYLEKANRGMRNCLCLFRADGSASCAYVYPYRCNGMKGAIYDGWANDQDYALYFAIEYELL